MAGDKPDEETSPPFNFSQLDDDFAFTVERDEVADRGANSQNTGSSGADLVPSPCVQQPVAPQGHIGGTYQPLPHNIHGAIDGSMDDFVWNTSLLNPQTDRNSTIRSHAPGIFGSQGYHAEENRNHQLINSNNSRHADRTVDGQFFFGNRCSPRMERNVMPNERGFTEGCKLVGNDGELKISNTNNQQITGSSMPVLYHSQSTGEMGTDSNFDNLTVQNNCTQKLYGSFLTLGIGDNAKDSTVQEEVLSCPFGASYIQQNSRNFSSQENDTAGELSSNVSSSGALHASSDQRSGFVTKNDAELANFHLYKISSGASSPDSLNSPIVQPCGTYMQQDQLGQLITASNSSTVNAAGSGQFLRRVDNQPDGHLQLYDHISTTQDSSYSRPTEIQITDSAQTVRSGLVTRRPRIGSHDAVSAQYVTNPFAGRIISGADGKQYFIHGRGPSQFPVNFIGPPLAIDNQHRFQAIGPIQPGQYIPGPFFPTGQSRSSNPAQVSTNSYRPFLATGQAPQHGMSIQSPRNFLRPTTGINVPDPRIVGPLRAPNFCARSSLKRVANRPPSNTPTNRRRIMPSPSSNPHMPSPSSNPHMPHTNQYAPSTISQPRHSAIPSSSHIKWQGLDEPRRLTGIQCGLCKRDLAYAPEGPVQLPDVLPVVAVLPCHHVFHDHCLQLIATESEPGNPPCIPCALREN